MATEQLGLRERSKQRRIERILDAAAALLREHPDRPLTVERIAAGAEVAPATVFNLVGTRDEIWAALAARVFGDLDAPPGVDGDPHAHARAVVDGVMRRAVADGPVVRALLAGWSQSGRVLQRDPVDVVLDCLRAAQRSGAIGAGVDVKRLAAVVGAGINGAMHQWAAGLIGDRTLRSRCRDAVDVAFVAARPDGAEARWELGR